MDNELDQVGEALTAALAARAGERPDPLVRERLLRRLAQRQPRPAPWARAPVLVAAVLVLLLAGSLAWGLSLNRALADERNLRQQLESAAARDEVVFDVVDARNVSKVTLRSPNDDSPTAPYGKAYVRPDMPYVVAMAGRLPPPPSGLEYHFYLDDRLIGRLAPNDGGFDYFVYRASQVGITFRQARVVVEAPAMTNASGAVVLASPTP
jgi:hypothetical protein